MLLSPVDANTARAIAELVNTRLVGQTTGKRR